jgi:hypothetical protein
VPAVVPGCRKTTGYRHGWDRWGTTEGFDTAGSMLPCAGVQPSDATRCRCCRGWAALAIVGAYCSSRYAGAAAFHFFVE